MSLQLVLERFFDEADIIEAAFHSCSGAKLTGLSSYQSAPLEEGCLVALWDAWGRFLRDAVISSCAGPVTGLSGTVYVPTTTRAELDTLHFLKQAGHCGTYAEPTWHSPQVLSTVTRALSLPNQIPLLNGIGVTSVVVGTGSLPNPLAEIRACRNFVAHKTSENVNKLARFGALRVADLQSHLRSKRQGSEHFVDLIDACRAVAEAALN